MPPIVRILSGIVAILAFGFVARADEYDTLRQNWVNSITGGGAYNTADSAIASAITSITNTANSYWSSMNTAQSRAYLWSDTASSTVSANLTTNYSRLRAMSIAWATTGSSLQGNSSLLADIIGGLDWMYANRYNENVAEYDNWWDFEIGSPLNLVDTTAILYAQLTAGQLANYMNAVNKFTPSATTPAAGGSTGTFTGANRMWKIDVVAIRGIIVKDSAKIASARDAFGNLFVYVPSSDGFYTDGSFIQHTAHPYTGGYGADLFNTLVPILTLLSGSTWAVTDPNQSNVIQWVDNSYKPLIYRGGMMDMVCGREVSRSGQSEHAVGQHLMQSILQLAQTASATDAARMKAMVKYWAQADTSRNFIATSALPEITQIEQLMADSTVTPTSEPTGNFLFADMDRIVHLRPGFGFGLSLHSSRIYNYESINGENLHGWYQGEGATYLYNSDLTHYSDSYWPTVNPLRLPGTTVDMQQARANSSGQSNTSPNNWVGGASYGGYGVAGMQLSGWSNTLIGKKSWFMFDNEVVCLGAGITSTDGRDIQTTVESRLLNSQGNNGFIVNGATKSTAPGWSETMTGVTWAHLTGRLAGSDIGYYFPGGATVSGVRETRTGAWSDINTGSSTTQISRNFLSLWFDHGVSPTNATYAYVLLPGRSTWMVADYAANPQVTVIENSGQAQCVQKSLLGITAANFWNDTTYSSGGITVNKKASVFVHKWGAYIDVAVSDPTQANTGTISVTLASGATSLVSADPGITVTQVAPNIQFTVNVSGAAGKTFHVRFYTGTLQTVALSAMADAYVWDANPTTNYGTATTLNVKKSNAGFTRESYLRFNVPAWSGLLLNSTLRLTPLSTSVPGVHGVASVSDNSWVESGASGITWNTKPTSGNVLSTWTPAVGVVVNADVSSAVTASGLVSFHVYGATQTSDGYVTYGSRENTTSGNQPQLVLAMGHTPPTVALTSPTDGTLLSRAGSLTLTASASGTDGTVTSVTFYDGATLLGTTSSSPFTYTIANIGGGIHRFTAVATDSNGLTSTSLPVVTSVPYPPTAAAGVMSTAMNTAATIDLRTLVTDADTPPTQLRFSLGAATNGIATLLADGHTVQFTPASSYTGAATFSYTVTDATPDPRTFLNYTFQASDATDASGDGHDGSLVVEGTGATSFTSDLPTVLRPQQTQSLTLTENGTAGAARVESPIATADLSFLTADWTISGWFKRANTTNIDSVMQLGESGGWGPNALSLVMPNGSSSIELRDYSGTVQDVSIIDSSVSTGTWHHFAVIRGGTSLSLYIDGALIGTDSGFNLTFDSTKAVKFGGVSSATANLWDRWFNGSLADLAVFNGALSAADVSRLAAMPAANFSGQTANNSVGVTVLTPLQSWRQNYFGYYANAGAAADTATPQNDGITNLLKFATGMNPTKPGTMPGTLTRSANNLLFTYTPAAAAVSNGVTFTVEYSDTLAAGSWKSDVVNQGVMGSGGTPVTASVPKGANGRRYVHLKVTSP